MNKIVLLSLFFSVFSVAQSLQAILKRPDNPRLLSNPNFSFSRHCKLERDFPESERRAFTISPHKDLIRTFESWLEDEAWNGRNVTELNQILNNPDQLRAWTITKREATSEQLRIRIRQLDTQIAGLPSQDLFSNNKFSKQNHSKLLESLRRVGGDTGRRLRFHAALANRITQKQNRLGQLRKDLKDDVVSTVSATQKATRLAALENEIYALETEIFQLETELENASYTIEHLVTFDFLNRMNVEIALAPQARAQGFPAEVVRWIENNESDLQFEGRRQRQEAEEEVNALLYNDLDQQRRELHARLGRVGDVNSNRRMVLLYSILKEMSAAPFAFVFTLQNRTATTYALGSAETRIGVNRGNYLAYVDDRLRPLEDDDDYSIIRERVVAPPLFLSGTGTAYTNSVLASVLDQNLVCSVDPIVPPIPPATDDEIKK